jgi:tetratricopeptide (TPR) repeat protein
MMTHDPAHLEAQGKRAFENKNFTEAANYFQQAAEGYTLGRAGLQAAEMMNNASVAFLQANKPNEALKSALGTDEIFAGAKDIKRQAMALGNQAAALEALSRNDEAIEKYEQSADLFGQINEGDLRAMVMKSAAAIKLKTGKITDSAFKMMGSLDVKDNPSFFERILRFFMRFIK